MIKASELRNGNYLIGMNGIVVFDFNNETIRSSYEYYCRPIPLTEDLLIKNGTIDENGDFYIQHPKNERLRFYLVDGYIQLTQSFCCPWINFEHVTTVHLFQNLYFALTGEELPVKWKN